MSINLKKYWAVILLTIVGMAFYGSVWSSMIWLLMTVCFSSLRLALSRHTI